MKKVRVNLSLDQEEIDIARQDAPRGNVSQYIGDLIRRAHDYVAVKKIDSKDWAAEEILRREG